MILGFIGFDEGRQDYVSCRLCTTCWLCVSEPGGAEPRLQAAAGAGVHGLHTGQVVAFMLGLLF